ncbi:TonB-dependent receptor domain-containing protein [Butyricimonas virosa]|uniref:TonB-dependent receptor domain-containing protein n=1 Tax=Butyricimonas virosa TaxID=544645 RepID=UPI002430EEA1|nr:TonB-dependent receptor [Butyricimonas virosa]
MIKNVRFTDINFIIVLIMLFCCPIDILAQHTICSIAGKVIDEGQNPVPYASVAIYSGTVPITGVITDNDGKFLLKINHSDNEYRLAMEFIGYSKYEGFITPNKAHINLGVITLKEDTIALGEVVVTGKEVARKSTVEHTTINASANMVSSKGTVIDILRSVSSVSISNDEIAIRGNKNILVLMDGVPTTAGDLSTIPAANIQSIEVITNPDASHDAGGTGGIINIISKRSRAEGFSGMVAANYGFSHFASGNIAISYNRPNTSWRFSYNAKYEDDVINSTLNRKVHHTGYEVFQQMQSTRYTFNNNISLCADFRINPRNRLSVDAKVIIPRLNVKQDLHNTFADHEEFRYNDVTWNRVNIEGLIAYTHIIKPEVSDITIRGSMSRIWGERPSHYWVGGVENNRSVSGGSPFIPALQADYKHEFGAGTLSVGAKLTYRQNDVYHEFYELSSGDWVYSDNMSKDMLHTEFVPAAYAMFSSRISKKFTYKVGLRGEFSTVTLNSKHDAIDECNNSFFLAPSLSGTYKLAENQDLSLALSRRIGRPTYPQLIPYMSMVDATTYEQGNMHLDPEKATKVDLSYNINSEVVNLFVNGYLNYTTDYISQVTKMDGERLITTYANADSDLKTGVELSLKVTPAKWVNFSVSANTYYVTTEGIFKGTHIDNNGWTNNSNLMFNFIPWKGGDIQVQYFVTTPQYYPQLTTSLTHQMNIGIKQRLLKSAMTVSVLVTDVLNTAKWEVWSHNNLFDLMNSSKNKSRMLWLGVSYNFNSFKQKGGQKTETNRSLIRLGM